MFIEIKSKEQFLKELNKNIGQEVVFYYFCDRCEEEQVTDKFKVIEDTIEYLKGSRIYFNDCCTKCEKVNRSLSADEVFGIEVI